MGGEWWPNLETSNETQRSQALRDFVNELFKAASNVENEEHMSVLEYAENYGQQIYSHATVSPWWDVSIRFLDLMWNLQAEYKMNLLPHVDLNVLCLEVEHDLEQEEFQVGLEKDLDEQYLQIPSKERGKYWLLHEKLWVMEKISQFIPTKVLPSAHGLRRTSALCQTFQKSWEYYGGVPHFIRVMAIHPEFAARWIETTHGLMSGNGPVVERHRHYMAILACSTHNCNYMIEKMEYLFTLLGGDLTWLQGIKNAPEKMQRLAEFNAVLAHQPWKLTKKDIKGLLDCGWSRGQIAHAILIMSCFHALSGIIFSCGILPDANESEITSAEVEFADLERVNTLPVRAELFKANPTGSTTDFDCEALDCVTVDVQQGLCDLTDRECTKSKFFLPNQHGVVRHEDFDGQGKHRRRHPLSEFNWKDDCFGALSDFDLKKEAEQLHLLFEQVQQTPLSSLAGQDTSNFKDLVWLYVHNVYGIHHDDFDYSRINTFFTDPNMVKIVKSFIKRTACYPETCEASHFHDWGYAFSPQEKVHVALLSCEARAQAELIHGLRALSEAYA
eukprot:GGOE01022184.1.p1 GENE.GGOE01022184.1~~GGOE01022184.1.p1  ORF type:complete len:592 (-),score=100.07 GGOE01022184.1:743-2416(-)